MDQLVPFIATMILAGALGVYAIIESEKRAIAEAQIGDLKETIANLQSELDRAQRKRDEHGRFTK